MADVAGPKQGLMNIGEEAKPPFVILPDPASLFKARSERLARLAPGHQLEPYLAFLARLASAQAVAASELAMPTAPGRAAIAKLIGTAHAG